MMPKDHQSRKYLAIIAFPPPTNLPGSIETTNFRWQTTSDWTKLLFWIWFGWAITTTTNITTVNTKIMKSFLCVVNCFHHDIHANKFKTLWFYLVSVWFSLHQSLSQRSFDSFVRRHRCRRRSRQRHRFRLLLSVLDAIGRRFTMILRY